jgi:hypothetical protein
MACRLLFRPRMRAHLPYLLAASGLLVAARPAAAAPAWCRGAQIAADVELNELSSQDPREVIEAFVKATCAPSEEVTSHAAQIEQGRKAWGKRLGMEEGDWADAVAWVAASEGRDTRLGYSTKDATQFTAIDQYVAITSHFALENGASFRDWIYTADAFDAQLTQVGRLGVMRVCLKEDAPSAWAICQGDLDAFDLGTFGAQLRADAGHPGDQKMELRLAALELTGQLKDHAAKVAAAWKQDPAYKQMFEVSARGRAEWATTMAKQTSLIALALQMDSASRSSSRHQREGCEATTAAALATAAGKIPGARFKGLKDEREDPFGGFAKAVAPIITDDPELSLAAIAYIQCQPASGTSALLARALAWEIGYRGPRSMAWARMLAAKITLDDASAKIDWPGRVRNYGGDINKGSAGAVVASTRIDGDLVIATPAPLLVKVEVCQQSHSSNRITRIRGDGVIEYEDICDKSAMVTQDHRWAPFKIKKAYAPLLAKGVKFSAVYGQDEDDGRADVVAVWPNEKAEVPSWFLGAKVK